VSGLSLLLALFSLSLGLPLSPQEKTRADTRVSSAEAAHWREDVRWMAEEMPKRHKNLFHAITRGQFESAVRKLDERVPSLARHQILVEMARIAAMIGDGHTNIAPTRDPKIGFRAYPSSSTCSRTGSTCGPPRASTRTSWVRASSRLATPPSTRLTTR
jgi:hypothetical protein